jgi:hypothetical protein
MLAQSFHILDEVIGRNRGQHSVRVADQRSTATATALIEEHRSVHRTVEVPPRPRTAAAARTAVEKDCRYPILRANGFPVQPMSVPD